ncbi:MAG: tetratricopeptide repeat protein [Bacteroidales bacterium]|nr:tetratricopeptide repeat protein [Bacteroidales bacterium]
MKHISLILVFSLSALLLRGQATAPIINYKALENKLEKSNETIENPKKNSDPKTWFSRGELFLEIYNINLQYLRKGMTSNELKILFGQPGQVQTITEGQKVLEEYIYERLKVVLEADAVVSWEETKKIHENPLPEAQKAFEKALELDVDKKLDSKIKEQLTKLKQFYENEGIINFNGKNYQKSYENFSNVLKINNLRVMEGIVDTLIYYSTGRAAKESGNYDDAITYFNKTLDLNFSDPYLYIFLNECYKETGDSAKALETLKAGFKKHPDNQPILIEMINFYLMKGESEAALEYLGLAKQEDPTNTSFIFAEGTIFDKLGRSDDAINAYKACLEIDPQYFNALFNLGVVYYNKAVKIIDDAQKIDDNNIYNQELEKAEQDFKNAIPHMEEAKKIAPENELCNVLSTLKTLYYRIKDEEKRLAVVDEMTMNGCE